MKLSAKLNTGQIFKSMKSMTQLKYSLSIILDAAPDNINKIPNSKLQIPNK